MRYVWAVLTAAIAGIACGALMEWINSLATHPLPSPTGGAIMAAASSFVSILSLRIDSIRRMDYIRSLQNVIPVQDDDFPEMPCRR